jgi:hypothetical protein
MKAQRTAYNTARCGCCGQEVALQPADNSGAGEGGRCCEWITCSHQEWRYLPGKEIDQKLEAVDHKRKSPAAAETDGL